MTKFIFQSLVEWNITELREFINSYDLGVKGRSKQKIVDQLQNVISLNDCETLITKFKGKTQNSLKSNSIHTIVLLEDKILELKRKFAKIEEDFNIS